MATPDTEQTDDQKFVSNWIAEIDACEKWRKQYLDRCNRIIARYRDERRNQDNLPNQDKKRFPILWSNIQTLQPAVYARTPEAVVTRRYRDSDPVGRHASEVLERATNYSCQTYDFDQVMRLCRDDYLLIGQGQGWVRYVPHVAEGSPEAAQEEAKEDPQLTTDAEDEGQAEEKQVYAEVLSDHVSYDDFGYTPCREWGECWYVFRRVYMDREELTDRFGKLGKKVSLDWTPLNDNGDETTKAKLKKAAIYEIWDKRHGEVIWISKSFKEKPLDRREDWLGLEGFFPCPRPLLGTCPQDKLIPVPDFVYYQDQAEELDQLTAKIGFLINAIKTSGFYAGEENIKLQNLFSSEINQLVAIDNMALFQEKGGFKGIIEWFPLDQVVTALKTAFETREHIIQDIYQITGIADIMRGATDPNETATAQGIKEQWGSLRVRDKQTELARFSRDIIRLKAEIIAKKFSPETLAAMTDKQLPTNAQKQAAQMMAQYQQQAQQMAAQGMQPPPPPPMPPNMPPPDILQLPSWEDVNKLLKDDALRSFRVDIETDSTIQVDEMEEKARRVEFITASSQFLGAALPLLQQYPGAAPLVGKTFEFLVRGFRAGRELEDMIEKTFDQIGQQPPAQPPGQKPGPDPQLEQAKLELEQQQMQQDAQLGQAKLQTEQQRTQSLAQIDAARLALEARDQAHQHAMDQTQLMQPNVVPMKPNGR